MMSSSAATHVVRVDSVSHYYGEGDARNQVLFHNCLEIGAGQLAIMTGPSGSGKTTLLTLIGALRSLQEGSIEVLGHHLAGLGPAELVEIRRSIGFIFQMHNLFDSLSAYENVKMAMRLGGCPASAMRARGAAILSRLGLDHRIDYKPKELSGGERQRVAIARALVNRPKLVLADEPTAALDSHTGRSVMQMMADLAHQRGRAVVVVTHDSRVLEFGDRIVKIEDGLIASSDL
ncbi:MAG TPA: ATP-binding cassette domain-containing protein, partial [Ktedonobacterales bacterium]|nr:ATP-binding cassette domain-containing protein [Ktedonobacterales bacterium]